MKKSTKYRILGLLSCVPWLWMLVPLAAAFAAEKLSRTLDAVSDWLYDHAPDIPDWWTITEQLHKKQIAAEWEEYEQSEGADPRVLAGKPKCSAP